MGLGNTFYIVFIFFFRHPVASTDMWPGRLKRSLLQHPSVFTSIWAVFFDFAVGREPQNNILIAHPKIIF